MKKLITAAVMLSVQVAAPSNPLEDLKGFLKLLEGTWIGQGDGMSGVELLFHQCFTKKRIKALTLTQLPP